jgi:glycosyltransferase involved in cell wall biosynthesis
MSKRVTVAVPVYRRLEYLPGALRSLVAQDHPDIEILVSDNGGDAAALQEVLDRHCSRPYRLRRNEKSVPMPEHFNQLVEEATGEYFVLLSDDDEISPNYVSALVDVLHRNPDAGYALGRLEVMDEEGATVPREGADEHPPPFIDSPTFVRMWCRGEYKFVCFVTNLVRTEELRAAGGYPDFPNGNWIDNAVLLKLAVGRKIAFVPEAVFRYRVYESSTGLSATYRELTTAAGGFLRFLDSDPRLEAFSRGHPEEWARMRALLIEMTWKTCRTRWVSLYRHRMSRPAWVRAAFTMPFIPAYYRSVFSSLFRSGLGSIKRRILGSAR